MEGRQVGQHLVLALETQQQRRLAHVGMQAAMAEHDPFGVAFAATGKQDGGDMVGVMWLAEVALQHGGRQQHAAQQQAQPRQCPGLRAQLLQQHQLAVRANQVDVHAT